MSNPQEEFNDHSAALREAHRPLMERVGISEAEALRNRITELEDLLRSAHAIAARQGADTHRARFAASIQKLGIGSVTARVYKLDRAEVIRAMHSEEPE